MLLNWVLSEMLVVLLASTRVSLLHLCHCVLDCSFERGSVVSVTRVNVECPSVGVNVVAGKYLGVSSLFAGNDSSVVGGLGSLSIASYNGVAIDLEDKVSMIKRLGT